MNKILLSLLSFFVNFSLFSMQENSLINNDDCKEKPTITACMQYYCCSPEEYYKNINPKKLMNIGKCLTGTGLTTKTVEFSIFSCCYPDARLGSTCQYLWFPPCNVCSTASNCCGGTFDIGCTIATLAGPIVYTAGKIWEKYKKEPISQNEEETL